MNCTTCQHNPCICNSTFSIAGPCPKAVSFGGDEIKPDPFISSSTGVLTVKGKLDYGPLNLIELYLQGKDLDNYKEEYVDAILQLPWVNNDNLKAMQAFDRLRNLFSIFKEK